MKIETALLSVSNKEGLPELAQSLHQLGIKLLSTGGTARMLEASGVPVTSISSHTGFPEILDGRVKSLHPRIHGGILARFDDSSHQRVLAEQNIPPIGLVVVNLYPFQETIARSGITTSQAVEQIDIGGPTLLRAAAKNHRFVTAVVDPADYQELIRLLHDGKGRTSDAFRREQARKVFRHTSGYDAAIAGFLNGTGGDEDPLPEQIKVSLRRRQLLRYGENPHQTAALYEMDGARQGLAAAPQLQGKELSFNNFLDLEAAWNLCGEFDDPACIIVKHNNPCGTALGSSPAQAYAKALQCDPVSAFGSIIAFNREVDGPTAEALRKLFVEALIAPGYSPEAREILSAKRKLRVLKAPSGSSTSTRDFRKIDGGFLIQDADRAMVREDELETVTSRRPEPDEVRDLLFAWKVAKHVKSNAIVLAREARTIGIGAGQMSRVDSVQLAIRKARSPLQGCVLASDAFFPFRDGLDEAAAAGVKAVIQPGGSVRDAEVTAAADEHGIAMVLTRQRHFRH